MSVKRLTPNPKYENLKAALDLLIEALDRFDNNRLMSYSKQENRRRFNNYEKELKNAPTINKLREMKKGEMNDIQFAKYLYKNFNRISGAKVRTYLNETDTEPIPLGRPRKEVKAERKKADRYKSIYEIKKSGYLTVDDIKKISYDDIRKLTLKESQKVAYYIQQNVKRRYKTLAKQGITNTSAQRSFENYGGFLRDIKTASINDLKSFIKRGGMFLRSNMSTKKGMATVRKKTVEGIKKATGVDLEKYSEDESYDLFWDAVYEAEHSGLATVLEKEKYEVMTQIDYYLQGKDIDDIRLQDKLDTWFASKQESIGIYLHNRDDIKRYLSEKYDNGLDDYV